MNLAAKLFLCLLVALVSFSSTILVVKLIENTHYFPQSFIKSIDCPTIGNAKVQESLNHFNELDSKEIVKTEGLRPITIAEMDEQINEDQTTTLGYADVKTTYCNIYLDKRLPVQYIRSVVVHELCHCFGIEHTKDPRDLMYPIQEYSISEENLKYYAKIIHKIEYGN